MKGLKHVEKHWNTCIELKGQKKTDKKKTNGQETNKLIIL